jgi:hypothetical protein
MFATFNRLELELTLKQAQQGGHQGQCLADIKELMKVPAIKRQFKKIPAENIRAELYEYGAWDNDELQNIEDNQQRILWLACNDIVENYKGKNYER